jgi:hypothetical protein
MKKILLAIFALTPMLASAYDAKIDGIYYNLNTKEKTAEVTCLKNTETEIVSDYSGDVTIPKTVLYDGTEYSVTYIGQYAFIGCSELTSVSIPNSVTGIGFCSFYGCGSLTSVVIPEGVTIIENSAFSLCSSLASVTLPNSLTQIYGNAFEDCKSLTSVVIPENVKCIDSGTFRYCENLASITLPNGLRKINSNAFYSCKNLSSITIPNSVTDIGESAFAGCVSLTSVVIPDGVEVIKASLFQGCHGLKSVTLPNSVTKIEIWAFVGCESLTSIDIPTGVTVIDAIFQGSGLVSVNIPNGVTEILPSAFYECEDLTSVVIPGTVTRVVYAFTGCKKLKDVYCYAENVPVAYVEDFVVSPFLSVDLSAATLHVPASSVDKYKADEYWGKFGTILPIEDGTTRIDATSSNCDIKAYGGAITVSGCRDGESVSVYSVSGRLISATTIKNGSAVIKTNLQAGSVVIVKIGQKSVKLTLN